MVEASASFRNCTELFKQSEKKYHFKPESNDFYARLGITHQSSLSELKKAFRTAVKIYHPDVGGNIEHMKRIVEAYGKLKQILSGPSKIPQQQTTHNYSNANDSSHSQRQKYSQHEEFSNQAYTKTKKFTSRDLIDALFQLKYKHNDSQQPRIGDVLDKFTWFVHTTSDMRVQMFTRITINILEYRKQNLWPSLINDRLAAELNYFFNSPNDLNAEMRIFKFNEYLIYKYKVSIL